MRRIFSWIVSSYCIFLKYCRINKLGPNQMYKTEIYFCKNHNTYIILNIICLTSFARNDDFHNRLTNLLFTAQNGSTNVK